MTVDKAPGNREVWPAMKKRTAKKMPLDYPDETPGSRMAAEVRRKANKLTAEQRREHFERAMAMIYGGVRPEKTARD